MKPKMKCDRCSFIMWLFDLQSKGKLKMETFKHVARVLVNVGRIAEARLLVLLRPKYSYRQMKYVDKLVLQAAVEIEQVTCQELGCPKKLFGDCFSVAEGKRPVPSECHPESRLCYTPEEKEKMGIVQRANPKTQEMEYNMKAFNVSLFVEAVLERFQIAFDRKTDSFYLFQGGCWQLQETGRSSDLSVQLMNFFDRLVPTMKWSSALEERYLKRLAQRCRQTSDLKAPPEMMINAVNGIIDLSGEEVELLPHDSQYFFTYTIGVKYKPDAECPAYKRFLAQITKGDESMSMLLNEWLGYAISHSTMRGKCLFLTGGGANGKSSFLNIVYKLAGSENGTSSVPMKDILDYRFGLFSLIGKTANISEEVGDVGAKSFEVLKKIVQQNVTVQVEGKGKNQFQTRLSVKVLFACNEMPRVPTSDLQAIKRRFCIVPFEQTFAENPAPGELPMDHTLSEKLERESEGILVEAIEGVRRVLKKGFTPCARSQAALDSYLVTIDAMGEFVRSMVIAKPDDPKAKVNNTTLRTCFQEWAVLKGMNQYRNISPQTFRPLFEEAMKNNKISWYPARGVDNREDTGGITLRALTTVSSACPVDGQPDKPGSKSGSSKIKRKK